MTWTKVAVCAMCDADLCCAACGREQPDDMAPLATELVESMQFGFMTVVAGGGTDPKIEIKFRDLAQAHRVHRAILKLATLIDEPDATPAGAVVAKGSGATAGETAPRGERVRGSDANAVTGSNHPGNQSGPRGFFPLAAEFVEAMEVCEGISSRDGSREDPHIKLKFKDFADAHRAHRAIHALALTSHHHSGDQK